MKNVSNKLFLFYEIVCIGVRGKAPFLSCVCVSQTGDRETELLLHTIFCLMKFDLVY